MILQFATTNIRVISSVKNQKMTERKYSSPFNSLTSVIILALFFIGLFYIARAAFWILSMIAPVLIIATLIIDHTVITNYGKWIISLLKKNPLMGIGAILLTIFGLPVVSGFLFAKALVKKKFKKVREQMEQQANGGTRSGEFIEFEDVEFEEEPPVMLELPELKKRKEPIRQQRNEYDDLFE